MYKKKNKIVAALFWMYLGVQTVYGQNITFMNNGLALTPPMGWNSWNTFKKNPTEQVIRQTADAMVKSGLKKAGYIYVNIDDFWSTGRDESGKIIVDTVHFPSGMKALVDYIHKRGLKAGIYTNIGEKANYPTLASGGYYDQDMKTFAQWGFDYVKVDVNFAPERTEAAYRKEFINVEKAILNSDRPMVFSMCNQGGRNYQNWAPYISNSWRVGADIDHVPKQKTQWEGVMYELDLSASHPELAGPGHWNDADMMLVGVGSDGGRLTVMTAEEQKTHFLMWCIIASPLIIGNDVRTMPEETIAILTNKEAIAINQDKLGMQGKLLYEQATGLQVWAKQLYSRNKNKYAIIMFNRTNLSAVINLDLNKLGITDKYQIRDIIKHKNLGKIGDRYPSEVPAHGAKMFIVK